jgi:hypothetical protein
MGSIFNPTKNLIFTTPVRRIFFEFREFLNDYERNLKKAHFLVSFPLSPFLFLLSRFSCPLFPSNRGNVFMRDAQTGTIIALFLSHL